MAPDHRFLEELRPRAFAIAYRMLGSVGDAEDIAQEALTRIHHALEAGHPDKLRHIGPVGDLRAFLQPPRS